MARPASVRVRGDGLRIGSAAVHLPGRAGRGRAGSPEQRARGAHRRARRQGADPLLRGRAALGDEVPAPGGGRRQEPAKSWRCSERRTTSTCGSWAPIRTRKSSSAVSRRRARSCSRIAASSSAASRPGAFSGDQLQMIADFVDRRGGGLLMLGGARSFGEGGYGGTPVADALPLLIDPRTRASEPAPLARLKIAPTRAGSGACGHADRGSPRRPRWRAGAELPLVTSRQRAAARQAWRDGAAQRHRRARTRAGMCSRRSGSAAARRSR